MVAKCPVCDCEDFDLQDGLYYCAECCTQSQVIREEGLEDEFVEGLRNVRVIGSDQSRSKHYREDPGPQWRMVQAYNIILRQQTLALSSLGAGPSFQEAVLQIWSRYLKECEQGYVTSDPKWTPRLCSRPYPRDVQVTAGSVVKNLRLVKRGPNKVCLARIYTKNKKKRPSKKTEDLSEEESKKRKRITKKSILAQTKEEEGAGDDPRGGDSQSRTTKKNVLANDYRFSALALETFKKVGSKAKTVVSQLKVMDRMGMPTLVSVLCLALRLTSPSILLSDVSRWIKESRIPYMQADKHLPADWKVYPFEERYFSPKVPPRLATIQTDVVRLARFIGCLKTPVPSIQYVAARYLADLNLPYELMRSVSLVVEQFMLKQTPKIRDNVEYQAGISILFVLKHTFGLDNKTEKTLSALSRKANLENTLQGEEAFFVWCEWQEQMGHVSSHIRTCQPYSLSFSPEECQNVDIIISYVQSHVQDPCKTDDFHHLYHRRKMEKMVAVKQNFSRLTKEGRPDTASHGPQEPPNSFPIRTLLRKCASRIGRETVDFTRRKVHPRRSTLYWFCHQTSATQLPDSFMVPFYLLQEVLDWNLKEVLKRLQLLEYSVFGIKRPPRLKKSL